MSRIVRTIRATIAFVGCLFPAAALADTTAPVSEPRYASVMRTINPHLAEAQSLSYANALLASARAMHVDPTLMMAVVTVESHWRSNAVSYHGAEGLGQLKPETARELGVNPWSARSNLSGIAIYLHQLLTLFRDAREPIRAAIAGYNAGPYAIGAAGRIPQNGQTPRYVAKVMSAWHALRTRLGGDPSANQVADALQIETVVSKDESAYWGVH